MNNNSINTSLIDKNFINHLNNDNIVNNLTTFLSYGIEDINENKDDSIEKNYCELLVTAIMFQKTIYKILEIEILKNTININPENILAAINAKADQLMTLVPNPTLDS